LCPSLTSCPCGTSTDSSSRRLPRHASCGQLQLSVSIASPLSNISSMEHQPGTIKSGAGEDPLSAVLTTDSQYTGGSITTSNTGETMRPVFSAPLPPLQPASEQSMTDHSAAPPIGGHSGLSNLIPVPQFYSTPAPPRSKLHPRRYYNSPQLSGIMDGPRAITDNFMSQHTNNALPTSGSITSSGDLQPTATAATSPAHSSDSGVGSSPHSSTSPIIKSYRDEDS
jgi:hypothetical protein